MPTASSRPPVLKPRLRPLAELRPHPENPQNGDLDVIMRSLLQHGQHTPIVVTSDGTVLIGNHRYAAALELGWTHINVVERDVDPMDPAAIAVMLDDNHTSALSQTDEGGLLALLERIDLATTTYVPEDVADLRALLDYRGGRPLDPNLAPGSTSLARRDGVAPDKGGAGWLPGYTDKASRPIILDYPLDEYEEVVKLLARARLRSGADTNAAAVRAALESYVEDDS